MNHAPITSWSVRLAGATLAAAALLLVGCNSSQETAMHSVSPHAGSAEVRTVDSSAPDHGPLSRTNVRMQMYVQ